MTNRKSMYLGCIPGDTLEQKFSAAKEAGFAAIEPPGQATDEGIEELAALYKKYDIICPSVMTDGSWNYPGTSSDPEVRAKSAQCLKNAIKTAAALGANTVLSVPGAVTPDISYEEGWANAQLMIKSVIPYAQEMDVCIAIENVWNKFLLSPREFVEFVDSFGSKYVQAYFDVGNILLYGYPQQWIASLGERIKRVHIKGFHTDGFRWTSLLKGSIDWKAVTDALKKVGYDGWFTAELGVDERGLSGIVEDMDYILGL